MRRRRLTDNSAQQGKLFAEQLHSWGSKVLERRPDRKRRLMNWKDGSKGPVCDDDDDDDMCDVLVWWWICVEMWTGCC